jgi:DNA-binding MarR family transcriptional regulator
MALRATAWAWRQELRASEKLVLLALTDLAINGEYVTWLGQPRLCAKTGQSRTTMKRALEALAEKGLIERRQNVVHLHVPPALEIRA